MKDTRDDTLDYDKIGEKMILSALSMDDALADLLKLEVKKMKKLLQNKSPMEELHQANQLIRNVVFALTMTEDKISQGIKLKRASSKKSNHEK